MNNATTPDASVCTDCSERRALFAVGDRVRNTRPNRFGEPNGLPPAVIDILGKTHAIVRYDDDPADDPGYPLAYEDIEKLS